MNRYMVLGFSLVLSAQAIDATARGAWQPIAQKNQESKTFVRDGHTFNIVSFATESDGSVYWYETNTFSYWKKGKSILHDSLIFVDLTKTKSKLKGSSVNAVLLSATTDCSKKSSVTREKSTWDRWDIEAAIRLSYQQRYDVRTDISSPNDPVILLCKIAGEKSDIGSQPEDRRPPKAAISLRT